MEEVFLTFILDGHFIFGCYEIGQMSPSATLVF
jgi:hypothetical protein